MTRMRYSCKTLKTLKIIDIIILVKRDELRPYGDYRLRWDESFNDKVHWYILSNR